MDPHGPRPIHRPPDTQRSRSLTAPAGGLELPQYEHHTADGGADDRCELFSQGPPGAVTSVAGPRPATAAPGHEQRRSRNPAPGGIALLTAQARCSSFAALADACRHSGYAAAMSEPKPTLHLTAVVTREGDWYVARCLEIEAVSQGETVEQALANLRDVVEVYLEEDGAPPVPAPVPPLVTSIDVQIPA
jgi:predicted RNase H-like HicB family nuclease